MRYNENIKLRDGRECCLRNAEEKDGQAVLDNFILTHLQTDNLASYADEITLSVEEEKSFLKNKADILFALKEDARQLPGVRAHDLFTSRIYLITDREDPLAGRDLVREADLYGRTLMVGGGSPPALKSVQHRLIASGRISYFNSADHDTTLTNVAARRGVCLAPGFLNDHSGQFAWVPFDCPESFSCQLLTHQGDARESLSAFIGILQDLYRKAVAFPL